MQRMARRVFVRGTVRGEPRIPTARLAALLGSLQPERLLSERRQGERYAYPRLIFCTPVADDSAAPIAPSFTACGKQLSQFGIGFFHPLALPYRRLIVTLEESKHVTISFLTDLTWCRFTKQGWYESGGRFLEEVPSPRENAKRS